MQLVAAWEQDAPAADRRAAVLAMWLNTADNDDGERVREMIEVFIDANIQASATPLTAEEINEANATRAFPRRLEPVDSAP